MAAPHTIKFVKRIAYTGNGVNKKRIPNYDIVLDGTKIVGSITYQYTRPSGWYWVTSWNKTQLGTTNNPPTKTTITTPQTNLTQVQAIASQWFLANYPSS